MQPGIYTSLSNGAYHASAGISKSGLALMRKTPAHYAAKYIYDRVDDEPSKAMVIGSAFHTLVLEPDKFSREYATAPKVDKRTKAGKAEFEQFSLENAGKTLIDREDLDTITEMSRSIRAHTGASSLLELAGIAEESFYWIDEQTGHLCKCRSDWRIPDMRVIVDLKSTDDASPEGFARSIYKYTYHIQAAWYMGGISQTLADPHRTFIFIAVEKTAPYAVACYKLDADSIDMGRREADSLMRQYAWCKEHDIWPAYPDEIQEILLPRWAQTKEVTIYE